MNQRWSGLCARIRRCTRSQRLRVIALLDTAVEEEYISQRTADDILTEWDVLLFPEQMPRPLVEHVRKLHQNGGAMLSLRDHPEEEDEPCAVIPISE